MLMPLFEEDSQKLEEVCNELGMDEMLRQCSEECAELIQAAQKLRRVFCKTTPVMSGREKSTGAAIDNMNNLLLNVKDNGLLGAIGKAVAGTGPGKSIGGYFSNIWQSVKGVGNTAIGGGIVNTLKDTPLGQYIGERAASKAAGAGGERTGFLARAASGVLSTLAATPTGQLVAEKAPAVAGAVSNVGSFLAYFSRGGKVGQGPAPLGGESDPVGGRRPP